MSVILQGASYSATADDTRIVNRGGGDITVQFGSDVFIYGKTDMAAQLVTDGLGCLERDDLLRIVKQLVEAQELSAADVGLAEAVVSR